MKKLKLITALAVATALGSYANAASIVIKPTNAVASTEFGGREAGDTLNDTQSEIDTGASIPGTWPTVSVVKTDNWLAYPNANIVVADQWIVFDLGDTYNVEEIHVWNYWDVGSNPSQGVDDVDMLFATTLTSGAFGSVASLADYSGSVSLNFAEQTADGSFQGAGELVSLGSTKSARYVLLDVQTNHGYGTPASGRVGLGEIRFTGTAVPEPTITALLGLGGLALILRRRR
jgi:hypothetical protein